MPAFYRNQFERVIQFTLLSFLVRSMLNIIISRPYIMKRFYRSDVLIVAWSLRSNYRRIVERDNEFSGLADKFIGPT
jgi:hypothetical protein